MRWFEISAALVLVTTGGAKVWSGLGDAKILTMTDPLPGMSFQHLLTFAGVVEIGVAILLLSNANRLATFSLVWLATNFAIYRIGLWWIEWQRPCPCLGNLSDALHISAPIADKVMKVIFAYLLIGSYWLLLRESTRGQNAMIDQHSTVGRASIDQSSGNE